MTLRCGRRAELSADPLADHAVDGPEQVRDLREGGELVPHVAVVDDEVLLRGFVVLEAQLRRGEQRELITKREDHAGRHRVRQMRVHLVADDPRTVRSVYAALDADGVDCDALQSRLQVRDDFAATDDMARGIVELRVRCVVRLIDRANVGKRGADDRVDGRSLGLFSMQPGAGIENVFEGAVCASREASGSRADVS